MPMALRTMAEGSGRVDLVGAGPGAADLITRRGLQALQRADVVLYDALIDPELLTETRPGTELLAVGKRGYCIGSTRQETINEAMVRLARAGKRVCRLKCGDPCMFGRGGEEAEFLAAAGVPFTIVPGVTSALGACAAAGIPLTHRAVGPSVTFVTGHHDPDSPECPLDWSALARLSTLVFYMGVRHLARIAAHLQAAGMPADLPLVVIESGTRQDQTIHPNTLQGLQLHPPELNGGPALLIVGEVVQWRDQLGPWMNAAKLAWSGAAEPGEVLT